MNRPHMDFWLIPYIDSWKKQRPKISCYCPFKILSIKKTPVGKKYFISRYSTAQNMPKIAEVKLSSCRLEVADFWKKLRLRNCGVAEQHFLKSCGIAIAEVLRSSCGIAIADSKKSCVCPPLVKTLFKVFFNKIYMWNSAEFREF